MVGESPLPDTCDDLIVAIVEYWQSLIRDDVLPDRGDLDPIDIPQFLPGIALIDVERNPWRFRFRLLGDELIFHHGVNLTGEWLDEAFPHFPTTGTMADMIDTAETGRPNYRRGSPQLTYEKSFIEIERVMLPFRNGGEDVELILIYSILE